MNSAGGAGRFVIQLHCLLIGRLVDSSSLFSFNLKSVSSLVGEQVVLPCSLKNDLGDVPPPACHIQWRVLSETVFEKRDKQKWEADEYKGRVEVPEESLGSGDCSLIINDVQIRDTGRYESFMLVDGEWPRTRVFIQSVKLSVFDHKLSLVKHPGEDLVLDLFTSHSVQVVFQGRNSSQWTVLWMKHDENSDRVEEEVSRGQVRLQSLQSSDGGTYKVLDEHGLTISTVQLSVIGRSTALKFQQNSDDAALAGDAAGVGGSALLIWSALLTVLLTLL
ncbi:uncharacterized protein ACBR49_017350 isoform 2-T2 [Aulostomus maculatus]